MTGNTQTVFVSSSRDMSEWAALAIEHTRDFAARHGLSDLRTFDYRDIDPADLDHAATWQDAVGAPSRTDAVLTLVLLGERVGTPLPSTFALKHDIYDRLMRAGHTWVHVAGLSAGPLQMGQVPLTGVLFEFFDAFLPRTDGSQAGPLRVVFKGKADSAGDLVFGNGEFSGRIESAADTLQRKRQLRKEYEQQVDWLYLFWSKIFGLQQHVNLVCADEENFITQLEQILAAQFLANPRTETDVGRRRLDPYTVELPGPAPYDLERACLYFGRGPQIAELARRTLQSDAARRVVPVVGESGAGKSSLLRGGLLNHALSPARKRLGWRAAFLSLAERAHDQSPLAFLARALASESALPELGSADALVQRLEGVAPEKAAERLLEILASLDFAHSPGLGRPKLLIVVDQLELALDGTRVGASEIASGWQALLQVLAALGSATQDPAVRDRLDPIARRLAGKLPVCVVLGVPEDRFKSLQITLEPGDHIFWLTRLVDDTALREVVNGTFDVLGLTTDPKVRELLCRDAITLALGTEASVLPVLAVTLASLHGEWKWRREREERIKESGSEDETLPRFQAVGMIPPKERRFDIQVEDLANHRRLEQAIARLGDSAWSAVVGTEEAMKGQIAKLPISAPRHKVASGEIAPQDFVLAWLLRRLIAVSGNESAPDQLKGLPDSDMPVWARPLAESLRRNRLLTQHGDGTWWLAHQVVVSAWPRAAEWREAEKQSFRTMNLLKNDQGLWKADIAAGYQYASDHLWTRSRDLEWALEWMSLRGADDDPDLAEFIKESTIAAAREDTTLAGRCLRAAVWFNDASWAAAILAVTADKPAACNMLNREGNGSALNLACTSGNLQLARMLLDAGARPTLQLVTGRMPLHGAAAAGSTEVCDLLIAAGAEIDRQDKEGNTALMLAVWNGHMEVVERLLAAGATVRESNVEGRTALMLAAGNGYHSLVTEILAAGAAVNETDSSAWTALTHAASGGYDAIVQQLLDQGATPDHPAVDGQTPLMLAAANGGEAVVALLLAAGAAVEAADNDGSTPLIHAATNGSEEIVGRLLAVGASVLSENHSGATPLTVAAENGHDSVVARLLAAGAEVNHFAFPKQGPQDAKAIESLIPPGSSESLLKTDLSGAFAKGGNTALTLAARHGTHTTVARLLAAGADPNLADADGKTALMYAAIQEDEDLINLLLSRGADSFLRDPRGRSALDFACLQEARRVIDLLLLTGVPRSSKAELESMGRDGIGNIGLVVNARGKMCLVHDTKLGGVPIWVGYHMDKRQLEIFFETGSTNPINWEATDEMDQYLQKINKILLIRMQHKKPLEGYDTSLLHLVDGKAIELE